jgi:hypothetical protein
MGNIKVIQYSERFMPKVAYKCTHRETEIETRTEGYYEPSSDTFEETSTQVEICLNPPCEAWRYPEDVAWEDDYMVEVEHGEN